MFRPLPMLLCLLTALPAWASSGLTLAVHAGDGHGHVRKHFVHGQCGGDDASPRVQWSHAPPGTRSFALTVFDPDANHGAGWWHWVVVDLPASSSGIGENAPLPPGTHALRNDFGVPGWGGPCPPAGDPPHHYVFTLYALDVPHVSLSPDARPAQALAAFRGHVLAKATMTFLYGR